jgi:hypothetical protein
MLCRESKKVQGLIVATPAASGTAMGPVENKKPKKSIQDRFRNYLSLLFSDLCAKDNGLTSPRIHSYTFLKVGTSKTYLLISAEL